MRPVPTLLLALVLFLAATPVVAVEIAEEDIVKVTADWSRRVFLAVADAGPSRIPVKELSKKPSALYRQRRVGCAVFLGEGRLLLTTASVVGSETEIAIFDEHGNHTLARLLGRDELFDLALVEAVEEMPQTADIPLMKMARNPLENTACLVLGSAYGGSLSATLGRIERTVEVMPGHLPTEMLRVLAPVYPGDSGAPVLDGSGRFLGLLTAVADADADSGGAFVLEEPMRPSTQKRGETEAASRTGLAVPANQVQKAWHDLRDHGYVLRGFLGVTAEDAADFAGGAHVVSVVQGSPASISGIRPGDTILRYGKHTVVGARQLSRQVATSAPGAQLTIDLIRDGGEHFITVQLGDRSALPASFR